MDFSFVGALYSQTICLSGVIELRFQSRTNNCRSIAASNPVDACRGIPTGFFLRWRPRTLCSAIVAAQKPIGQSPAVRGGNDKNDRRGKA